MIASSLALVAVASLAAGCTAEGLSPMLQPDIDATVEAAVKATIEAQAPEAPAAGKEEEQAGAQEATDSQEITASNEATMLITPTPDQSAAIMDIVVQNTRHFRGNPDASVVIVEFSDFL